ncbi:quinol monooxygenase YgiN [Kineosphaera limosa]|uniref:ABM domain-containing protein n=1 Tax=Kineosphaera limosa NBRC 100340 TaxID=1184609 RepID=K6X0H4_9MICO|nr:putative quinol monooxygenase [Kineosphaera limosa]NYE00753.1 quinol monooxygenase YgiN [Kineosphaera limosa]GAB97837.1 hypothetical protein KILIM_084_00090 [Kineosphaera limosa NBRC 100340]
MIALTVTLQVQPGHLEDFLAAITTNAERTFTDEPGCRYFDVNQSLDDDHRFVFYELYDDEAAVEAHRAAPHFATWREAAGQFVVSGSQVNTLARVLVSHAGPTQTA